VGFSPLTLPSLALTDPTSVMVSATETVITLNGQSERARPDDRPSHHPFA
jgi:hypothetical protein